MRRKFLAAIVGFSFLTKKELKSASFVEALPSANAINIATTIHNSTTKTPVDTDELPITDSATSFSLKKLTLVKLKSYIFGDTKYLPYDFNTVVTPGIYNVNYVGSTNMPILSNGLLEVVGINSNNVIQVYKLWTGVFYTRALASGIWTGWAILGGGNGTNGDCKAYINFNGTGIISIRKQNNISSITDNGIGDYQINLSTSMSDPDYVVNSSCTYTVEDGQLCSVGFPTSQTINNFKFRVGGFYQGLLAGSWAVYKADIEAIHITVYGN